MVEGRSDAAYGGRIRYGMVGGGQGAFIGAVHRLAARMDDQYEFVAAPLPVLRLVDLPGRVLVAGEARLRHLGAGTEVLLQDLEPGMHRRRTRWLRRPARSGALPWPGRPWDRR